MNKLEKCVLKTVCVWHLEQRIKSHDVLCCEPLILSIDKCALRGAGAFVQFQSPEFQAVDFSHTGSGASLYPNPYFPTSKPPPLNYKNVTNTVCTV